MERAEVLACIKEQAIIAIVRTPDPSPLVQIAEALAAGGLKVIEFSLTVPGVIPALTQVRAGLPREVVLGVGTVLDAESARTAILAGAQFVVMPALNVRAIRLCRRYGVLVLPGAFTPTEILRAWEVGGDMVKLFPATVLGPGFCRDVHGPLPQIPLVPVGGISLDNTTDYLRAGAAAVGVGGSLVSQDLVKAADWAGLTRRAEAFRARVAEAWQSSRTD